MQSIHDIFALWPSIPAMAKAINENSDTVLRWRLRGRIPEDKWPIVMRKGSRLSAYPLTADILLKLNRPMKQRGRPPKKRAAA